MNVTVFGAIGGDVIAPPARHLGRVADVRGHRVARGCAAGRRPGSRRGRRHRELDDPAAMDHAVQTPTPS